MSVSPFVMFTGLPPAEARAGSNAFAMGVCLGVLFFLSGATLLMLARIQRQVGEMHDHHLARAHLVARLGRAEMELNELRMKLTAIESPQRARDSQGSEGIAPA
jgi:hypothetical protein